MNCDRIQPILLDYGKGLLSGPEAEQIKAHLEKCAECAALLDEEIAFSQRLAALPDEQPANEVWALVRARTKPRGLRPIAWLRRVTTFAFRKVVAAAVAILLIAVGFYALGPGVRKPEKTVDLDQIAVIQWSDDPLGDHTDAMIELIDNM